MKEYNGKIEGADGLVAVEYLGGNFGTERYRGAGKVPNVYLFSASKRKQYMPIADAEYFEKTYWRDDEPTFRIVKDEQAVVDDSGETAVSDEGGDEKPSYPDVTAENVSWIEDHLAENEYSAETLDLMLADEKSASNGGRSGAIKHIEKAIGDAIAKAINEAIAKDAE